jgi:hypothetical protein
MTVTEKIIRLVGEETAKAAKLHTEAQRIMARNEAEFGAVYCALCALRDRISEITGGAYMNDLDQAQKAALHAQAECLKAQDACLKAQEGEREALRKRGEAEAYAELQKRLLEKAMLGWDSVIEDMELHGMHYSEIYKSAKVLYKRMEAELSACLAKNPNPAGHLTAEASSATGGGPDPGITNEASGPVGLGPDLQRNEIGTACEKCKGAGCWWCYSTGKEGHAVGILSAQERAARICEGHADDRGNQGLIGIAEGAMECARLIRASAASEFSQYSLPAGAWVEHGGGWVKVHALSSPEAVAALCDFLAQNNHKEGA